MRTVAVSGAKLALHPCHCDHTWSVRKLIISPRKGGLDFVCGVVGSWRNQAIYSRPYLTVYCHFCPGVTTHGQSEVDHLFMKRCSGVVCGVCGSGINQAIYSRPYLTVYCQFCPGVVME